MDRGKKTRIKVNAYRASSTGVLNPSNEKKNNPLHRFSSYLNQNYVSSFKLPLADKIFIRKP
jgi:hypothetical protein